MNANATNAEVAKERLIERAILTRALCQEWRDCDGAYFGERCRGALGLLDRWLKAHEPAYREASGTALDGLDRMAVPPGCEELIKELRDGSAVEMAFSHWRWSDTHDADRDKECFKNMLDRYWVDFPKPATVK